MRQVQRVERVQPACLPVFTGSRQRFHRAEQAQAARSTSSSSENEFTAALSSNAARASTPPSSPMRVALPESACARGTRWSRMQHGSWGRQPLQYTTVHYSTLQYTTVHYSTLQYTTVHYMHIAHLLPKDDRCIPRTPRCGWYHPNDCRYLRLGQEFARPGGRYN